MDRNHAVQIVIVIVYASLSARRAWIEITQRRDFKALGLVALRKESVDRNLNFVKRLAMSVVCRSPQGERG